MDVFRQPASRQRCGGCAWTYTDKQIRDKLQTALDEPHRDRVCATSFAPGRPAGRRLRRLDQASSHLRLIRPLRHPRCLPAGGQELQEGRWNQVRQSARHNFDTKGQHCDPCTHVFMSGPALNHHGHGTHERYTFGNGQALLLTWSQKLVPRASEAGTNQLPSQIQFVM